MHRIFGLVLAVWPSLVLAGAAPPDTPAGHALGAFLDAINSSDRARQQAFIEAYPSFGTLDDLANWRAGVGGYDLLEIYRSDSTNVFFRVKQRSWPVEEAGRLQVSPGERADIVALGISRVRDGARFEPVILDEATRARVVGFVASAYESSYVDEALGKRVAATLKSAQARGEYRGTAYGDVLAQTLTRQLGEVTHDRHTEVRFSYFVKPELSDAQRDDAEAGRLAAINCEFEKSEHLPARIGYLKVNGFADPRFCASAASAALTAVADSDALIIDLRENHGGNAEMANLFMSYFFDERVHLADVYTRTSKSPKQSWTMPDVPGRKFVGKPVVVMTSRQTFSAGEAVAYLLQAEKRATVIGEVTGGGGHIGETRIIDDHFSVRVPTGNVISPVTRSGFEGTGVVPDVKVAADQALDVAMKLATDLVHGNSPK